MFGIFSRIGRLFRGFISLFVTGLEERNPEALLEAAKQEFRDKMAQYNRALAGLAGIVERLKIQINNKTANAKVLEQRILANYKAGNTELAGSLARELQELKTDLEHDSVELKESAAAYEDNVGNVKIAQKEYNEKVRRLERELSRVKIKEAQAEAAAALSGIVFKVGDTGDALKSVEEVLAKKYEKAAGKARVVQDLGDADKIKEKETERKTLDQVALADFLAQQGIQVEQPSSPGVPTQQKEIGPQQKQAQ